MSYVCIEYARYWSTPAVIHTKPSVHIECNKSSEPIVRCLPKKESVNLFRVLEPLR